MFISCNPYSNITNTEIPFESAEIYMEKANKGIQAFKHWKQYSFDQKAALFKKLSFLLQENKRRIAVQITGEMGKPIGQSIAEIEKCALTIDWYCEHGSDLLLPEEVKGLQGAYATIHFEPLGTVLGIMPWNFPFWQVFRYAIPTLLAGNVTLLKHAPNVPLCARSIENLFLEAGFPEGVFQSIYVSTEDTGKLIESTGVHAVTFTGSEGAGRSIAAIAGKSLKKCVLELGGSDPFIVLADTDLDVVVAHAITGRLQNNGQSCIASKRFIIEEGIYNAFMQQLKERVALLAFGDPMSETTDIGPLARPDLKTLLKNQLDRSVQAGAQVYYTHPFNDAGTNFFAPVILENIPFNCPARTEELFGPVFSCFKASDPNEAIHIANETSFGLGASIWSTDTVKAETLAYNIESGSVFINGITKSDPRLPFGGIKHSGYGRELSVYGMHEFVNIKTYWKKNG